MLRCPLSWDLKIRHHARSRSVAQNNSLMLGILSLARKTEKNEKIPEVRWPIGDCVLSFGSIYPIHSFLLPPEKLTFASCVRLGPWIYSKCAIFHADFIGEGPVFQLHTVKILVFGPVFFYPKTVRFFFHSDPVAHEYRRARGPLGPKL